MQNVLGKKLNIFAKIMDTEKLIQFVKKQKLLMLLVVSNSNRTFFLFCAGKNKLKIIHLCPVKFFYHFYKFTELSNWYLKNLPFLK